MRHARESDKHLPPETRRLLERIDIVIIGVILSTALLALAFGHESITGTLIFLVVMFLLPTLFIWLAKRKD